MKLFISRRPKSLGGGSNTFAWLFSRYARKSGHKLVRDIRKADRAIVIAHLAEEDELSEARTRGCTIVHRLDEYFDADEGEMRRAKHEKIVRLNRLADITVFQSRFVFDNVYPHIKPENYRIILNGSDPSTFAPPKKPGELIGHVSWGVDTKKRLDLLHAFIRTHPDQKFLLVGRHAESPFDFQLPNVILKGPSNRNKMPKYYRAMSMLYFPSEKDPCPNTVIESILSGVPVCYNPDGGTVELVRDCGLTLDRSTDLMNDLDTYRARCSSRADLDFGKVFERYMDA